MVFKRRTINETKISLLFKIIEKKAGSSLNFKPFNFEILPVKPKLKTITKIKIKGISKLLTKTLSFLAAYTLCQFPWWNKFVAATAIKKTKPNWKEVIKDLLSNLIKFSSKILRFRLLLFWKNIEKIK